MHAIAVYAATVVAYPYAHRRAFMARRYAQLAAAALARLESRLWLLYAMVHGVANDVQHGLGKALDNGFVQFGIPAADEEFHFFIQLRGQVARKALEFGKQAVRGHEAHIH
jgi:hypothetical protein